MENSWAGGNAVIVVPNGKDTINLRVENGKAIVLNRADIQKTISGINTAAGLSALGIIGNENAWFSLNLMDKKYYVIDTDEEVSSILTIEQANQLVTFLVAALKPD